MFATLQPKVFERLNQVDLHLNEDILRTFDRSEPQQQYTCGLNPLLDLSPSLPTHHTSLSGRHTAYSGHVPCCSEYLVQVVRDH